MTEPRRDGPPVELELVACPQCGAPAELVSEGWLDSTQGPVEHFRVWCARRHFFFMPRPQQSVAGTAPQQQTSHLPPGAL